MNGDAKRVLLFGATGTIGRATYAALVAAGHDVTCFVRPTSAFDGPKVLGEVTDPDAVQEALMIGSYEAVMSCLASRNGAPADAWAIDHDAHISILNAAKAAGVTQFILLSAICVQKPRLAFQQAKLAFEDKLTASGLTYSIVRPTAYFKSLSGQIARVQAGKAFLMFGDGALTACKPISDRDLAEYLVGCLDDAARHNAVLPIGGPGPALTPKDMGAEIFRLSGKEPRYRHVPVVMMRGIIGVLSVLGIVSPKLKAKAELARIGHYYATESMLVWDGEAYDAAATPETGKDTLFDYYADVVEGRESVERGDHAVF